VLTLLNFRFTQNDQLPMNLSR